MKRLFICLFLWSLTSSAMAQADTSINLWMWTTGTHYLHDGNTLGNYGISLGLAKAQMPGPLIRVQQGQKVTLEVRNQSQGAPHTIHLHGLDVDQANDGVPATSFSIPHKETRSYEFKSDHPGNYLYHCHVASVLHVQFGMYGCVIVEPKNNEAAPGYFYGRDHNLLMSEADKSWFDNKPKHATGDSVHALFALPVYDPDYFFVNGQSQQQIDTLKVRSDENVLIRLSNVGYFENRVIFPSGLTATLLTSDGRPLPNKTVIDTLLIAQGERFGVLLSPLGSQSPNIEIQYLHMFTGKNVHTELVPIRIDDSLWPYSVGENSRETKIKIYPNPASDFMTVSNVEDLNAVIEVLDIAGHIMEINTESIGSGFKLNLTSLPTGSYILQIKNRDQLTYSQTFQKL